MDDASVPPTGQHVLANFVMASGLLTLLGYTVSDSWIGVWIYLALVLLGPIVLIAGIIATGIAYKKGRRKDVAYGLVTTIVFLAGSALLINRMMPR